MVLLLRTAHYNLAKLRDVYLHTNTLAALANLAPHARDLSSHAAQRLVSLFDMLGRRYATVPFFPRHMPSPTSQGYETRLGGKCSLASVSATCPL